MNLHASAVTCGGKGVLLLGESGSGKSDLALRLMDRGATLVADDRVEVLREGDALWACSVPALAGRIELRGVGILQRPYCARAKLALAVRLVAREAVERMPEPEFFDCEALRLPLVSLHAFDHSTPIKIHLILEQH